MKQAGKEQISSAQTSDVRDGQFAYCCHLKDVFSWGKKGHNCEYAGSFLACTTGNVCGGELFSICDKHFKFSFLKLAYNVYCIYVQS